MAQTSPLIAVYFNNTESPLPVSPTSVFMATGPSIVDSDQLLVQRVVGFTLAGLTCAGSLFLFVFAAVRLSGSRSDLVHGLGVHAGILGFWQGAYVMIMHTLVTAFPVVRLTRLWRFNCLVFNLTQSLFPSVYLSLTFVLLVAYWTVRFPGRRAISPSWRCVFLLAHTTPWLFALGSILPVFVKREVAMVLEASDKRLLCDRRPTPDFWTLVTVVVSRGVPLLGHCLLTIIVTLRRRRWRHERHIEVAPPRKLPLVVLIYFLVALVTEGSYLVSRIIDILVSKAAGRSKFSPVERRALTWTHYCHYCLAPPLLIFLMAHVVSEFRRIAHALNRKHVLQPPEQPELLYTNCMLTSL